MKKLALLAVLIAAYLGLTYYAGVVGEGYIREQVRLSQDRSATSGVTLELIDYQRGFFASQFQLQVNLDPDQAAFEPLVLTSTTRMRHGPVILADGLHFGWFYARSENSLSSVDAQKQAALQELLPEGLGRMTLLGGYTGSYDYEWKTPDIDVSRDGNRLQVAGVEMSGSGHFDSLDSQHYFATGVLQLTLSDGSEARLMPISGEAKVQFAGGDIPLSSIAMSTEQVEFRGASSAPVQVHQLQYAQAQTLMDGKVDTQVSFKVAQVDGLLSVSNIYYDINLAQTRLEAIRAWGELSAKLQLAEETASLEPELKQAIQLLLHEDARLDIAMGADMLDGYVKTDIRVDYAPPAQAVDMSSLPLADYLGLIEGTMEMRIADKVMTGTPLMFFLADYIDTYIVQEGSEYILRARLSGGELFVADTPVPLAMLFPYWFAESESFQ